MEERTAFATCPFCEATCGLAVTVRGEQVVKVRGDADDVFSRGFLCPKGVALKDLHEDPDRLRTPLLRGADGELRPASWEQAFAFIGERLGPLMEAHGRDAVAVYIGNPAAHGLAQLLYGRVLLKALGTRSVYSASTVDQRPKEIASALMYGAGLSVAIPDVDRTQHLLMLGANPLASNGSLMTAPDMRGRLAALQARGGKLVVVDPRRSRTAEAADEHHPIRPGTDAHLLFALVHVLFDEGLERARPARRAGRRDRGGARAGAAVHARGRGAGRPGIDAGAIRRMARELAAAESAAVYGRIGTTTQEFGTLASWLVDVLNVLTGNLDRPGGAMFPRAAAGQRNSFGEPGRGRGARIGRWHSRVRGLPESFGELPVAALAEEIETPGEGQVRALVTLAGNPARSTPNSGRIEAALESLDLYVAVDIYVNETTRHADVILPAPSPLQRSHYDLAFYQLSVRNVANYSPPVLRARPGRAGRVGDAAAAGRAGRRAAGARGRRAARPARRRGAAAARGRERALARARARRRGAAGRAGAAPRARAAARDPAALRTLRRRLRRAARRHRPRRARGGAARHRPRPARAAPAGAAAHAERADRARAGADRRRRRAAARRARAPARRATRSCSSDAASCARTTRGCTTSSCWSAARSAARCRCTPTTRGGSGSPTARRRACTTARASWRPPSR